MKSALPADIRVLLATDRFVVIDKPAGLLSVPGKGEANQACVALWVRREFSGATGPLVVHRLDMDTSGIMVCALDAQAQRALSAQFEARTVQKSYEALVSGRVENVCGVIDVPMRADIEDRPRQVVDLVQGRPATTAWTVLGYEKQNTRLQLSPVTGRTHQLRVHCAFGGPGGLRGAAGDCNSGGHPILGDVLYGDRCSAMRLMLHASRLAFDNPSTRERVQVTSPVPF